MLMPRMTVPALRRNSLERSHMWRSDDARERAFVGRQFHDQHGRLAFEQRFLEQPCHEERDDDPEEIHASMVRPGQ